MATKFNLEVRQFNVTNAFLNAYLGSGKYRKVISDLPEGYKEDGKYIELDRALYGLKESLLLQYRKFASTLTKLSLIAYKEEPYLFQDLENKIIVLFYVDDILVLSYKDNEGRAQEIISRIKKGYNIRNEDDIKQFLEVRMIRDREKRKLQLVYDLYIKKITKRYKYIFLYTKFLSTPLPRTALKPYKGLVTKA